MDSFSFIDSLEFGLKILLPIFSLWWIILPVILVSVAWSTFKAERKASYLASLKWVLLEIRVPKDPHRSPKAIEQVFTGLHGIHSPVDKKDAIFKGKIHDWFSFEITSTEGKIRFFVRTPEQYRNLVESQIYAQYSEVEIAQVEDYVNSLPPKLPNPEFEVWGAELALQKEDAYPIRTYEEFEEKSAGKDDIKRVDTMASLAEFLSTLHNKEHIWIQYLIRPAGEEWIKRAQGVIDQLSGKSPKAPSPSSAARIFNTIDALLPGGASAPSAPKEEKKPEMAPGASEKIRAIEKSINKLGHETGIRFVYIGPRDNFHKAHVSGIVGVFKQFSTQNLNGFKLDKKTTPSGKWPFKKEQELVKKVSIVKKFRSRTFTSKPFVLTTEELATIFHFPDIGVKSPLLPRVEAKKGEPPTNLPIIKNPNE